jgi:predicted ArsR family transcriptional regulator
LTDESELPQEIAREVDQYIDSLECLEVLLLMYRDAERVWSVDQIASELRIKSGTAARHLARMASLGLLEAENPSGDFRFHPKDQARATGARVIVEAYATRRIALINHIASRALSRIRSLADAFRVWKGKGED